MQPNPNNIYITNIDFYEDETANSVRKITYEYDQLNYRLLYILVDGTRMIKFNYDANGNLVSKENI